MPQTGGRQTNDTPSSVSFNTLLSVIVILPALILSFYLSRDQYLGSDDLSERERKATSQSLCPQPSDFDYGFPISNVTDRARELASHSWEYGTLAEALLELYNPELSVFGSKKPFASSVKESILKTEPSSIPSLAYAQPHIRLDSDTLCKGDGSSTDPASLGVSALLLTRHGEDVGGKYRRAADVQVHRLLKTTPRFWNGAISHRDAAGEVWADFVYMVPPFLALYGVITEDETYLYEAAKQIRLHRDVLIANKTNVPDRVGSGGTKPWKKGLWSHFIGQPKEKGGNGKNLGRWSTGNAWATAGMTRVLATGDQWEKSKDSTAWATERMELISWIKEILDGVIAASPDPASGLVRNEIDNESSFGDAAGCALLVSSIYRMAVLEGDDFGPGSRYLDWAGKMRVAVTKSVDDHGRVSPVVDWSDWEDWKISTTGSSEAQSFVAMMGAAWRDCICGGFCRERKSFVDDVLEVMKWLGFQGD